MKADQLATLTSLLSPYVELGNHRLQTLCLLITALVSARTVDLSHLAAERASGVLVGFDLPPTAALLSICSTAGGLGRSS